MLLYLNEATFVGKEGEVLAEEVRSALANGFPLVMVHENDKSAGGCEFAHFFVTTPQDRSLSLTLTLTLTRVGTSGGPMRTLTLTLILILTVPLILTLALALTLTLTSILILGSTQPRQRPRA